MSSPDIRELAFDDENEEELARHGITPDIEDIAPKIGIPRRLCHRERRPRQINRGTSFANGSGEGQTAAMGSEFSSFVVSRDNDMSGILNESHVILNESHVIVRNKGRRRGFYKIIGRDRGGRIVTVIVEPTRKKIAWRPVTGWPSTRGEITQFEG